MGSKGKRNQFTRSDIYFSFTFGGGRHGLSMEQRRRSLSITEDNRMHGPRDGHRRNLNASSKQHLRGEQEAHVAAPARDHHLLRTEVVEILGGQVHPIGHFLDLCPLGEVEINKELRPRRVGEKTVLHVTEGDHRHRRATQMFLY